MYLSAWDEENDSASGLQAIDAAIKQFEMIAAVVRDAAVQNRGADKDKIFDIACEELKMGHFAVNALFKRSIYSNIDDL